VPPRVTRPQGALVQLCGAQHPTTMASG
jgi:hypothetical protein